MRPRLKCPLAHPKGLLGEGESEWGEAPDGGGRVQLGLRLLRSGRPLGRRVRGGRRGGSRAGAGGEAEARPAVSISAGTLPGVWVAPFHIDSAQLDALGPSPKRWGEFLKAPASETVNFLLFGHPFTIPVDDLVSSLDQAFPSGRKVGGLASGGQSAHSVAGFLGDQTYFEGAGGGGLWGA